ncbi:hypothetical protein Droror1_Dr00020280 [Drosera rotundifolia]
MSFAIYHVLGLKGLKPGAFGTPRYKVGRLEQLETSEEAKARGANSDQGLDVIPKGLDTLKDMAQDMNEEFDKQVPLMDEIDEKDINIQDGCGTKFLLCRTRLFLGALFQYKSLDESSFTSGIMEVFEPATRVAAPALKPAIKFFWLFC